MKIRADDQHCVLLPRVALRLLQQDASELLRRACIISLEASHLNLTALSLHFHTSGFVLS